MYLLPIFLCTILVALDQYTKYLAYTKLRPIENIYVIKGVLNLTYVENRGAAFGLFHGARPFFVVFTIVVLIYLIHYYINLPNTKINKFVKISIVLISAGAIGNLIDRIRNGFVVDFLNATLIKFMNFPVFNLADIYVVVGTFLLAILLMFFIKEDEGKKRWSLQNKILT